MNKKHLKKKKKKLNIGSINFAVMCEQRQICITFFCNNR
jgi:hypothetical protein